MLHPRVLRTPAGVLLELSNFYQSAGPRAKMPEDVQVRCHPFPSCFAVMLAAPEPQWAGKGVLRDYGLGAKGGMSLHCSTMHVWRVHQALFANPFL